MTCTCKCMDNYGKELFDGKNMVGIANALWELM